MRRSNAMCVAILCGVMTSSSALAEVSRSDGSERVGTLEVLVARLQSSEPAERIAAVQALSTTDHLRCRS